MSYANFGTQINTVNHKVLKKVPYCKLYDIPIVLSVYVRGITKKVDEIQQIVELNNVSAICVIDTWLSTNVTDSTVANPGYNLFQKDRVTTMGRGVCIYLNSKIH